MSNIKLPTDAAARKAIPIYSGFVKYFPDAMAAVAACSKAGNDQHNPGTPLHWDRSKSGDELDALQRHLMEAGTIDTDGIRHSAKVAWRAMANLQKEIENERTRADATECFDHAVPAEHDSEEVSLVDLVALAEMLEAAAGKFEHGPSGVRVGPGLFTGVNTDDEWLYELAHPESA